VTVASLDSLLGWLRQSELDGPNYVEVPDDHVLDDHGSAEPFAAGAHYFSVQINLLQLEAARRWLTTWDPLVLAVTEFRYAGEPVTLPFVVGANLLRQRQDVRLPQAMVFRDTQVAGLHPYAGGPLAVTVVLYRTRREDYVKRLLGVVQKTALAIDFSTSLAQYLKLGEALVDGVETLLGVEDTVPVLGYRREFSPDRGAPVRPGFFTVFSGDPIPPERLWVRESRLLSGPDERRLQPVDGRDHILLSLTRADERSDAEQLPWFRPLWRRLDHEANVATPEAWKVAKAHLGILYEELKHSPDVTSGQAEALYDKYAGLAKRTNERALQRQQMGTPGELADPVRSRVAEILAG
jgi:hypothetical protein